MSLFFRRGLERRNADSAPAIAPGQSRLQSAPMSDSPIAGSCVCGAVHFSFTEPFRFFQYCHCSRCRKRSGSIHAANIAVKIDQLKFTKGEEDVQTFALESAKSWGNAFCRRCGSGLPWKSRNGRGWIVPAGALDTLPATRPNRNIYYGSRAKWHVDAATLDVFDAGWEPTK